MASDSPSDSDNWSLYPYDPNRAAPVFFAVGIAFLAACQVYLSFFRFRWRKFGGMMIWASTVWVAGFVCREISVYSVRNVGMFIAQYVMILIGPPLYAAAEYFILGRLLAYLPYHAPLHPGRVFSTFAILSVCVESLTGTGAGNSAGEGRTDAQRRSGLAMIRAALILQCFVEVLFISLVAMLEHRCRKAKCFPKHVRIVCYTLYVTSLMILVRCVVRAIEGFEAASCDPDDGKDPYCGAVSRNEWFLWTFEVANITLFVILLCIFHPGNYLPRDSRVFLDAHDGKTERVGPGFSKADKRPLLLTILDPFNTYGILTGRGMVMNRFWEEYQPIYEGGEIPTDNHPAQQNRTGKDTEDDSGVHEL